MGGGEGLEKVELSERRFMEGCAVQYRAHGEGGRRGRNKELVCWISRHISPFIRQKSAISSTFSFFSFSPIQPELKEMEEQKKRELLFSRKGH